MMLTYQAASSAASPSRPPLYTEFVGPQADARVELRCGRSEGPKVGTAHHQTNRLVENNNPKQYARRVKCTDDVIPDIRYSMMTENSDI